MWQDVARPVIPAFTFGETLSTCDLCGGRLLVAVDAGANVLECESCRYRFVSPRPSQTEIAASYSASDFYDGWIDDDAGRKRMWSKRLAQLSRLGPNVRLLDIGAGIGTFLALARDQLGWQVSGTELSTSAVRFARQHHGLELHVGQAEDLDLPSASFDLITLWHVLEHVPSPALTLTLCHRLLAPKGRLAIAVPNDNAERRWLVTAKARIRGAKAPNRYDALQPGHEVHLSQFSSKVLTSALRSRGFAIERVTVDDQYARPNPRNEALVRAYRAFNSVAGLNFGQATFVLARKESEPSPEIYRA
jgi:2-polyprenyl-3-methyl-5-hydroxy-6-metoxy-1,4-benzoquinol methylase